ncbi:putative DNA helicase [Helianthus annuus]|nr:putative DNA helicase [Helianthus annuus]
MLSIQNPCTIDLLKYPCVFVLSKKLNGMFGICYSFWDDENLSLRFLFGNQFSMEMAGSETVNMPKSYTLNMFKDFVPMCIFSEANQGEAIISLQAVIDNDRGLHMRPMWNGWFDCFQFEAPVKAQEVKRTRRDRGELEDIMFKLFERQSNWALKQLVIETDQPAFTLFTAILERDIERALCVQMYNKRGTNQGTYELKPEYKKSVEETGAE